MKKGKVSVEQVTKDGLLTEGYDESLSSSEIYEQFLKLASFFVKKLVKPYIGYYLSAHMGIQFVYYLSAHHR